MAQTASQAHASLADVPVADPTISRIVLGDVLHRSARNWPQRTAFVDGERRLTYAQADALSSAFAHHLLSRGWRQARIGMLCGNSADMLIAAYGIHKSGNVWVPANVMLGAAELEFILTHADVSAVVADQALLAQPHIASLVDRLAVPVYVIGSTDTRAAPAADRSMALEEAIAGQPGTLPEVTIDDGAPALIMYTSGTTGRQKGVMHSHRSVQASAVSGVATFGIHEEDVLTGVLPMFHCAQHCLVASGVTAGARLVIQRGFDPVAFGQAIGRERITISVGIPMMYAGLLAAHAKQAFELRSLRCCIFGMAPMPRPWREALEAATGAEVILGTGQTEMYPATMVFHASRHPDLEGNFWGVSTLVNETAIMGDDGRLLPPGEIGEIVHRGPNVMLGYYKDPQATAAARAHGWHHTGDLGLVHASGQLLFLDRKKDMVKTGGENVPTIKVEEVLLRHPAVANAAVVGLPHPHWGEAIAAFVILKPGARCSEAELIAFGREHLGGFEVPKKIGFVETFPATATGKTQKHLLKKTHLAWFDDAAV